MPNRSVSHDDPRRGNGLAEKSRQTVRWLRQFVPTTKNANPESEQQRSQSSDCHERQWTRRPRDLLQRRWRCLGRWLVLERFDEELDLGLFDGSEDRSRCSRDPCVRDRRLWTNFGRHDGFTFRVHELVPVVFAAIEQRLHGGGNTCRRFPEADDRFGVTTVRLSGIV